MTLPQRQRVRGGEGRRGLRLLPPSLMLMAVVALLPALLPAVTSKVRSYARPWSSRRPTSMISSLVRFAGVGCTSCCGH
jgi:hypothetical protein